MKIRLAIEWFLNPDHLPFIVAQRDGAFERAGIDFELIEPDEHYDGFEALRAGDIEFATNEPLHLIEQFDESMLSLGSYFVTEGGVLLKTEAYDTLASGGRITVTTPVSNPVTDAIGFEILRRYCAARGVDIRRDQVEFLPNGFEHIRHMKAGADAGWLYFYNFEGIEAEHEGLDVLTLDAAHAGFPNFSALDLFVNRTFYETERERCDAFVEVIRGAIRFCRERPEEAMLHYYAHTGEAASELMDAIIRATIERFDAAFESSAADAMPILGFFREIGITSLEPERFETAFLH